MPRLNNTAKVMLGILGDSNEDVRKGLEEDLALLPKKFSTMVIKNAPKIDEAPSAESIEKIAKELAETIADPKQKKAAYRTAFTYLSSMALYWQIIRNRESLAR